MKNIPVFSTEYGVGSLILREIPYKGIAYVKIQSSETPKEFTDECIQFCRMAGAERIFATGHDFLINYPLHTTILRMTAGNLPDTDAALIPVTEDTLPKWLEIYNDRMFSVDNAAFKDSADGKQLLQNRNGYFIHRQDTLLGIGIAAGDTIDCVISVQPGAGKDVVLALNHALCAEQVVLDVASTNERAIRLYEKLGFIITQERSRWYQLL